MHVSSSFTKPPASSKYNLLLKCWCEIEWAWVQTKWYQCSNMRHLRDETGYQGHNVSSFHPWKSQGKNKSPNQEAWQRKQPVCFLFLCLRAFTMFLLAMFSGTRTLFLAFARPAGCEWSDTSLGHVAARQIHHVRYLFEMVICALLHTEKKK